jgi:predicted dinucleotide-binding enzyme
VKVGILGSGAVGRTLAAKLATRGNDVTLGTRDVAALMAQREPGVMRLEPFADWHAQHPEVQVAPFAEAAGQAEIAFNATNGAASLAALQLAGAGALDGKVLVDVANPLDFSRGFPPTLLIANTDSLGEQIQRAFPGTRVVKTLNTVNGNVMVDPEAIAGGDHHLFVSGNDAAAKQQVTQLLQDWFGWRQVIDLGDITTARGPEMYLALWVRLIGKLGGTNFNIRVVAQA